MPFGLAVMGAFRIHPFRVCGPDSLHEGAKRAMGSIRCNRAAVCKLPTMAALSQLIPSRLYSPDELSPALLSAASAFGAQTQREAAVPPVLRLAGSTLAQKFRMGSQPDNVPFIPAPAEKKKIKLYSRDFYAVSTFAQPTRIWHASTSQCQGAQEWVMLLILSVIIVLTV